MSFFVSDSLKGVISEDDIAINTKTDSTFLFCLNDVEHDIKEIYIKEKYFIIDISVSMSKIDSVVRRSKISNASFKIGKSIINLKSDSYKIMSIKSCDLLNFVDMQILIQYNEEL